MKYDNTLVLAHYYTTPEVQALADFVGDSLELAMRAKSEKPKRIVFAGVKFMAETAKMLNPEAEVILPDQNSSCSLVDQTDVFKLKKWRELYADHYHVAYINSSALHKQHADIIVTSRIVEDVMEYLYDHGQKVIFSPDRNMGRYLSFRFDRYIPLWDAVCDVHDQFDIDFVTKAMQEDADEDDFVSSYLIAHIESPLALLDKAEYVGSTMGMLKWVEKFEPALPESPIIYVATEAGFIHNLREARPDLDIRPAPVNKNCRCAECPFMKKNKQQNVLDAIVNGKGYKIDYLTQEVIDKALIPVERMLEFQSTREIRL